MVVGNAAEFQPTHSNLDVISKLRAQGLEEPRWIITMTTLLLLVTAIMGLLVVAAT